MSTAHAPAPTTPRDAAAPILPLFLQRWSPRAFSAEGLREREGPSARRPLADSVVHGAFPAGAA
jgi:hypothetical protein